MAETTAAKKARLENERRAAFDLANPAIAAQNKAALAQYNLDDLIEMRVGGPTSTSQNSSASSVTMLTVSTARAMMQEAAEEAGYIGKFTKADVEAFMVEFKKKQDAQIERVNTISKSKTVPGATPEVTKKIMDETFKQEFPSFFKPTEFAKDFIWARTNFNDEATLGAKALGALASVRGLVDAFQILGYSDEEIKADGGLAKQVARGDKTLEEVTVELQQIAKKEYPQFADRFKLDPTLTTYGIASPILKMLATTWQMDVKNIRMDEPIVLEYLRSAGADGKGTAPSYNELLIKAKNHKNFDLTPQANEDARDAATSLGSMLGFGV